MLKVDLGPFCVIELSLSRGGEDAEDESIVHGPVDTKTRLQLIGERLDGVGLLMFAPMDPRRRREVRLQGSSSKPPSLNDGGADLFKRVTFDQVLKSVESSRER